MRIKRKIKVFLMKLHRKLLYREDMEWEKYGRQWRWHPNFDHHKGQQLIAGWDLEITKWEKKPVKRKWIIAGYGVGLVYNPRQWRFVTFHTYYDGNNCAWNYGPIVFYRHGTGSCKKCYDHA